MFVYLSFQVAVTAAAPPSECSVPCPTDSIAQPICGKQTDADVYHTFESQCMIDCHAAKNPTRGENVPLVECRWCILTSLTFPYSLPGHQFGGKALLGPGTYGGGPSDRRAKRVRLSVRRLKAPYNITINTCIDPQLQFCTFRIVQRKTHLNNKCTDLLVQFTLPVYTLLEMLLNRIRSIWIIDSYTDDGNSIYFIIYLADSGKTITG